MLLTFRDITGGIKMSYDACDIEDNLLIKKNDIEDNLKLITY